MIDPKYISLSNGSLNCRRMFEMHTRVSKWNSYSTNIWELYELHYWKYVIDRGFLPIYQTIYRRTADVVYHHD